MNSQENNFKTLLLNIKEQLDGLGDDKEVFKRCLMEKLDNNVNYYQSRLTSTCKYILTRRPLTMMRGFNKLEENQDND